jgi:DNA-3-methyladenine glycosylase II
MGRRPSSLTFDLRPVPPFRLDLTAWVLRRRPRNMIDRWDGVTYRRATMFEGRPTEVAVWQTGAAARPRLTVTATPAPRSLADEQHLRSMLNRLLGLRIDLSGWYRVAGRDVRLRQLAERFAGMKPPRFPTVFEALTNGIACQQLSLDVGLELLNRLAAKLATRRDVSYAFPAPADVARQPPRVYRAMGFSRQKTRALLELSRSVARQQLDLESLGEENDDTVQQRLLDLRGIGRWTTEYVLLRGLGRLHVFPGDDVGARNRLARWLGRSTPLDYTGVERAVAPWQPYAGMVYFHLLLDGLSRVGVINGEPIEPS